MPIRRASLAEISSVMTVEQVAAETFAGFNYRATTDLDPQPESLYHDAALNGRLLIYEDPPGTLLGFVSWSEVDGEAHLDEIGVDPKHQQKGIGSALLAAAIEAARTAGYSSMTLTTYVELPFNCPWYEQHGFAKLDDATLGAELTAHRAHEKSAGLDFAPRCAMRRQL